MFSDLEIDEGSPSGLTWKNSAYHQVCGKHAGSKDLEGYWITGINGRLYKNHRIIIQLLGITLNLGDCVDHIDGNTSNNKQSNLRVATVRQNRCNSKMPSTNTSGFKGVALHGERWRAYIKHEGRRYHLGVFDTPEEASEVVKLKRLELHGTFGRDL